jgi:hypothetical protein
MAAGISTVLMWDYVLKIKVGNSVPAGMLINLVVLMEVIICLNSLEDGLGLRIRAD